ncbi:MAG: hypothetical protein HOE90_20395 [Bacteriovoracaceae bacterium]|nr:hypothetical protein [Bacteriovoracaceae bacterium]
MPLLLFVTFCTSRDRIVKHEVCELGYWKEHRFYKSREVFYQSSKSELGCGDYVHKHRPVLRKTCQRFDGDQYGWRMRRHKGGFKREKFDCYIR